MLAHRGAARDHQKVGPGGAGGRRLQRLDRVAGDAELDGLAAAGGDEGGKRHAVGADDLIRPHRLARHDQLVPGGEDGDARPPPHPQPGHVHRRGEADVAGGEHPSRLEADVPGAEVEAGRAHVVPLGHALAHGDALALGLDVLLDDHRVGALGQRSAGEDADGLARPERALVGAARGRGPDEPQGDGRLLEVGGAHGVAVHGRDGDRRLRHPGDDVGREHPAEGVDDVDLFRRKGFEGAGDPRQGLLDGNHHAPSKVPDLPPLLWVRRMSVRVMARSTALHMS